jgi:acetyl esterase
MLHKFKVWLLRVFYRFVNRWLWKEEGRVGECNDLQLTATGTGLTLRLFANMNGAERPLVVFFHGGGWVLGDLDTHTPFCRRLSQNSDCSVVSVDYRRAPEHPFPAALSDALDAVAWIAAHPTKLGPNNGTIVLAGDSAGGNLAACLCLELPDAVRERVRGAALIYPVVDHYSVGFESYEHMARGHTLTRKLMHWFWDTYLADCAEDDPQAHRAMPLRAADVSRMPATFLSTAEYDPLRDEGIAFADKLKSAGVPLDYHHFEHAAHGFACSEGPTADFEEHMVRLCRWLEAL